MYSTVIASKCTCMYTYIYTHIQRNIKNIIIALLWGAWILSYLIGLGYFSKHCFMLEWQNIHLVKVKTDNRLTFYYLSSLKISKEKNGGWDNARCKACLSFKHMLKTVNTTWIKMTEKNFPEIIPSRKY